MDYYIVKIDALHVCVCAFTTVYTGHVVMLGKSPGPHCLFVSV